MSNLTPITPETFAAEVLQSDKPVIVDFWASWCGPCKLIAPRIEKLAAAKPHVKVVTVDCEAHKDWAKEQGVRSIPSLHVYHNGEKVSELVGNQVSMQLDRVFEEQTVAG